MADHTPLVLRRLLALRRIPELATAALAELATLAENLTETTLAPGTVIATPGSRLSTLHLIVEGRIEARSPGGHVDVWGPHDLFGQLEVLARRAAETPAVAVVETTTLCLTASDFAEVLEDCYGLLSATLRDLAGRLAAIPDAYNQPRPAAAFVPGPEPLSMVERLIVLRQMLPFAAGRLQALATIAHASQEICWPGGAVAARAGELAAGAYVILDGTLQIGARGMTPHVLTAGDSFGVLETLAGLPHRATLETVTPVRAMWSTGATILDVIEDHTDLGIAMIASLAGALLDAVHYRRGASALDVRIN